MGVFKYLTIKVTFISYTKNIRKQMGVIRAHMRIWTEFKMGTRLTQFFVIFYVTIWIMLTNNMRENILHFFLLFSALCLLYSLVVRLHSHKIRLFFFIVYCLSFHARRCLLYHLPTTHTYETVININTFSFLNYIRINLKYNFTSEAKFWTWLELYHKYRNL